MSEIIESTLIGTFDISEIKNGQDLKPSTYPALKEDETLIEDIIQKTYALLMLGTNDMSVITWTQC